MWEENGDEHLWSNAMWFTHTLSILYPDSKMTGGSSITKNNFPNDSFKFSKISSKSVDGIRYKNAPNVNPSKINAHASGIDEMIRLMDVQVRLYHGNDLDTGDILDLSCVSMCCELGSESPFAAAGAGAAGDRGTSHAHPV